MPRAEYRFVETRWGREKKDGRREANLVSSAQRDQKRGEQLPGPKGSPEFVAEYNKRLAAYLANPTAIRARGSLQSDTYTIGWAFDEYKKSAAWLHGTLGETTRGQRNAIAYELRREIGGEPLKVLNREAIEAALKRRAATPHRANHVLKTLRHFGDWAATSEIDGRRIINKNPCKRRSQADPSTKTQRSEFNPDAEDGHITGARRTSSNSRPNGRSELASGLSFLCCSAPGFGSATRSRSAMQHVQTDGSLMVRTRRTAAGLPRRPQGATGGA